VGIRLLSNEISSKSYEEVQQNEIKGSKDGRKRSSFKRLPSQAIQQK
jgi:hypothetical protein